MTANQEYALLGRTADAHKRAKRLGAVADRAQALGVRYSVLRSTTSVRAFGCIAEFLSATERWQRAATRRLMLSRQLRERAMFLLIHGVER